MTWASSGLVEAARSAPDRIFNAFPGAAVFWLAVLVLDVLTIIWIIQGHKRFLVKIAWILIIFFLPLLGLILYFFLGREKL